MTTDPRLDIVGTALANQSRSRMLCEMMDGRAYTNKELACAAEITAQTASVHLAHLMAAGLTTSLRSGRSVYHKIASEDVAHVLETLAYLSPTDHLQRAKSRTLPGRDALTARSCYNHIAGRLGVLITDSLIDKDVLHLHGDGVVPSPSAEIFFRTLGINLPGPKASQKPLAKLCLDWTERRHHLSGPLASQILDKALQSKWLERRKGDRALRITSLGYEVFARDFGISQTVLERETTP